MAQSKALAVTLPRLWLGFWLAASGLFAFSSANHQIERSLGAPGFPHLMGFDAFGRDLLQTTARAAALSSAFAVVAVALSGLIAVAGGGGIALLGPRFRFVLLRTLDVFLAFPSLLLALAWAAIQGPGWSTLIVSLALGTIPGATRLMVARAREILDEDFVQAAVATGATTARILRVHLAPGLLSLFWVKGPGLFAQALLAEATLSFLGIGAPIGRDTWGSLLAQGKDYLLEAPHLAVGTGVPLILTVLSLQLQTERLSRRHLRL